MAEQNSIVDVVFKKGVLFDITIGRWYAIHQMSTRDLLLEKLDRNVVYPGHKKLLPERAQKPFVQLDGQIRRFVATKSMPFPISGAVFVTNKSLGPLLKGLKKLRAEFEAEADDLVKHYEEYKAEQILALDAEAEKIAVANGLGATGTKQAENDILYEWLNEQKARHRDLYPLPEDLRAKFYVDWRMFKVNPMEGSEELSGADADFITQQQDALKKDLQKWAKEQSVVMHKALGKAAKQASQLLAENGKLNPKNLKPLFNVFEQFASIDFAKSDFQHTIDFIKKQYGIGDIADADYEQLADEVNKDKEAFSNLLAHLTPLAVEKSAEQAGLSMLLKDDQFKRVVSL